MISEADRLRQALVEIRNLLGPTRICDCDPPCDGLRVEAAEALAVAKAALVSEA